MMQYVVSLLAVFGAGGLVSIIAVRLAGDRPSVRRQADIVAVGCCCSLLFAFVLALCTSADLPWGDLLRFGVVVPTAIQVMALIIRKQKQ